MKKIIYLLSIVIIGCGDGFTHKERLISNYYLTALELNEDMSLSYSVSKENDAFVGVVNPTVFAIGHNEEFIIVKQHPEKSPYQPDKSITNYFIIPLKDKIAESEEKNVIGPMTKEEFEKKREELGVPKSLTFTKVFEELE